MKHHPILIRVQGGDAVPPNPLPDMDFGDTVEYSTDAQGGVVTIVFQKLSPFRADNAVMTSVSGNETHTVQFNGTKKVFECRCFVALPNGTTVGWQADPSISGGAHNVGH